MTTVSAHKIRQNFSQLAELAFYKNAQVRVQRNNKPFVRLVGEPFMTALDKLLRTNPSLAETLEIMLDQEMSDAIEAGTKDIKNKKTIPINDALKDD